MALVRYFPTSAELVTLRLPASKSIANRLLIIQSLCPDIKILGISDANDTLIMQNALKKLSLPDDMIDIDVQDAGTAARFLLARLAIEKKSFRLHGTGRMHQRPLKSLADGLEQIGTSIQYEKNTGFLPLIIEGKLNLNSRISLDASLSSQFLSAVMMVAPKISSPFIIDLQGKVSSWPYVEMTAQLMRKSGLKVNLNSGQILVEGSYTAAQMTCEKDWSAASYVYLAVVLSPENICVELELPAPADSVQGDARIAGMFAEFGIDSIFQNRKLIIHKRLDFQCPAYFEADFSDIPDMAQTFAVLCAALGIEARLSGLKSLRIKETDRLLALKWEMEKMAKDIEILSDDAIYIPAGKLQKPMQKLECHNDHRMAMALAPLVMFFEELDLDHPEVVRKSFPAFWTEFAALGIRLSEA